MSEKDKLREAAFNATFKDPSCYYEGDKGIFELGFDAAWEARQPEVDRLRRALDRCIDLTCASLDHRKGEFHASSEPCPVEALIKAALDTEVK